MLSIVLRPFIAFALFFAAAVIGRWILNRYPQARAILGRPLNVIPRNEAERRDWWPIALLGLASLLIFATLWFTDPLHH